MYIWWVERDSNPQCLPCGNGFTAHRNTTNRCRPPMLSFIILEKCFNCLSHLPINCPILFNNSFRQPKYKYFINLVGIEYNGAPCENRTHIRRLQVARFTIKLTGHISWSMWQDSNLRITVLQTVPLDHLGTHANYCLHFYKNLQVLYLIPQNI